MDEYSESDLIHFVFSYCLSWLLMNQKKLNDLPVQNIIDEWQKIKAGTSKDWIRKDSIPKNLRDDLRDSMQQLLNALEAKK